MAGNYTVSDVAVDQSQAFLRVARLSSGGTSYNTLAVSLDPRYPGKSEAPGVSAINEVYLPMTTEVIQMVDGDPDEQEKFLRSRSRGVDGNRLNLCLINYRLGPGETPTAKNLGYLNDLLLWTRNHVYLPPTVTFHKEDTRPIETRVGLYDKFVADMLALKNSTVPGTLRTGVMVPQFYPRRALDGLAALFDDEQRAPTFVTVDFANSKFNTTTIEQKLMYAHRMFKREKEEKYFLYGMRVRPKRRGPPPGFAEDMASIMSGLNAVGRPHRDTRIAGQFPPFSWAAMLAFHPGSYEYDELLRVKPTREAFEQYLAGQQIDVPNFDVKATGAQSKYGIHARNFARRTVNAEGLEIASEVRSGDSNAIKVRLEGKESTEMAKSLRNRI